MLRARKECAGALRRCLERGLVDRVYLCLCLCAPGGWGLLLAECGMEERVQEMLGSGSGKGGEGEWLPWLGLQELPGAPGLPFQWFPVLS